METGEEIKYCDEDIVKPEGAAFIKKYYHFTYLSTGVVACKCIKGRGAYTTHVMKKSRGMLIIVPVNYIKVGVKSEPLIQNKLILQQ